MKSKTIVKLFISVLFVNSFYFVQCQEVHKTIDWMKVKSGTDSETIIFAKRDPANMVLTIEKLKPEDIKTIFIEGIKCDGDTKDTITIHQDEFDNEIIIAQNGNTEIKLVALFENYAPDYDFGLNTNCILAVKILDNAEENKVYSFNLDLKGKTTVKGPVTENKVTINQLAIPVFSSTDDEFLKYRKRNRILLIDAHPNILHKENNLLLQRKKDVDNSEEITEQFNQVKALYINSSLGIMIRGYNLDRSNQMIISLNGVDYQYEKDIRDLWDMNFGKPKDDDSTASKEAKGRKTVEDDYLLAYLKLAYTAISKNEYLNINDLYKVNAYKKQLKEYTDNLKDAINPEVHVELGKILYWSPEFISLTPIAVEVPDNDEVQISLKIAKEGEILKEYAIGTYKTKGGMGFNIGSLLYVTGLSNNDIYTESVEIDSTTTELRARMDSTNKVSVGIGFNAEFSFRTGSLVRPTINVGFFVPLGQELVPYLAIGPGLTIGNKKVKFSLNGGFAFGQENTIAERYRDADVSNVTDITSITKKVWKPSWYVGIGISFNITK